MAWELMGVDILVLKDAEGVLTRSHCEGLVVNNLCVGQVKALRAVVVATRGRVAEAETEVLDSRVSEKTAEVTICGRIVVYLLRESNAIMHLST